MNFSKALLISLISFQSFGQKLLFHKNNFKETIYQIGDVISFRLKDKSKLTRRIVGFDDSLIVFQDIRINPSEIAAVYVDKKTKTWFILRYKYERVLPMIGVGYFLLDWINSAGINENSAVFGVSLLTAGILARLMIPRYIKIKGQRKLVILK